MSYQVQAAANLVTKRLGTRGVMAAGSGSRSKRERILCRAFGLAAIMGIWVACPQAAEQEPFRYRLRETVIDSGGGVAASARYGLVTSTGLIGGNSRSVDGRIATRQGFAASLNDPPRVRPDTVRRPAAQPSKIRVSSLLTNDDDPEADRLALRGFDPGTTAGGRVTLDNGWLLYEPPEQFAGEDSFTYDVEDAAGNRSSAMVILLLTASDPGMGPSKNVIVIAMLPSGHRYLAFAGIAGRRYTIEWSDQLPARRWQELAVVVADEHGLVEWVDATAPPPTQRFYRTVSR